MGGTGVDAYMHHQPIQQGRRASERQHLRAEHHLPRRQS